jgi:apolipoprotein N-acyltransferase
MMALSGTYVSIIGAIGLSASLLILIFPGFDIHCLAWVALVPLFLVIQNSGLRGAFLSSLVVGIIFYSGLLWWALSLDAANPFNFSLVVLANGCYFGLFGLFVYYFKKRIPRWNTLTFPTTWVLLEYIQSNLAFLAHPWGILGYSQYSVLPVVQIAALTGVYGVSFLIVMVNTVLAEIVRPLLSSSNKSKVFREMPWRTQKTYLGVLVGALILLSGSLLYGVLSLREKGPSPSLKVALVQGNVDSDRHPDYRDYARETLKKYHGLTLSVADSRPDLIVWPSSSVHGRIPYDRVLVRRLSKLSQKTGTFLLVGSIGYDKFKVSQRKTKRVANSAFLFTPRGKIAGRYDKNLLLPFDEYLPLRGYVKWPSWIVDSDRTDYLPGKELTVFSMNETRFGVLICWENLFPGLFRKMAAQDVDFMVSITYEDFTDDVTTANHQSLAMNAFRAIENGVTIVRAAGTGVSAIIEPTGRITHRVQDHNGNDVNVEGYLVRQIPLSSERTFYNRYGDGFVYVLLILFAGFVLLAIRR